MPRSKIPIVSLEEAKARFQEWRNIRRGKARIPAELWSAAVEVARKEGINRTARELHVAWDDLKRRMPATGSVSQQPAFVELVAPRMQSVPECTLEVEGSRGKSIASTATRMRSCGVICIRRQPPAPLACFHCQASQSISNSLRRLALGWSASPIAWPKALA